MIRAIGNGRFFIGMATVKEIRPQAGPQQIFLESPADVRIYGGSAGGGKSWSILLEFLRGAHIPEFNAVFFRRTFPMIRNPGGLWDASCQIYPFLGAKPKESSLTWQFPSGATAVMRHLKLESNVFDWQGAEVCYLAFDELTHFTEAQFWYMLSRNRSTCGIRPYVAATCNPDSDSWVRGVIDWWIGEDGLPIPDRSGALRYFYRVEDELRWADTPDQLMETYGHLFTNPDGSITPPKSLTFIAASIYDNQALMQKDPGYLANLMSLPLVDRERLLGGNWNVKAVAGKLFQPHWFSIVELHEIPPMQQRGQMVRFWDLAATEKQLRGNDPDWSVGIKAFYINRTFYILDVVMGQWNPAEVDRAIITTAQQDGALCLVRWEQEKGSAGLRESHRLQGLLRGIEAMGVPVEGDKVRRSKPLSRAAEFGEVKLLRATWNQSLINEFVQFPDGLHDDQVDSASGAYNCLTGALSALPASVGKVRI
jgi:predicted phage terminase large subunit-like protein